MPARNGDLSHYGFQADEPGNTTAEKLLPAGDLLVKRLRETRRDGQDIFARLHRRIDELEAQAKAGRG